MRLNFPASALVAPGIYRLGRKRYGIRVVVKRRGVRFVDESRIVTGSKAEAAAARARLRNEFVKGLDAAARIAADLGIDPETGEESIQEGDAVPVEVLDRAGNVIAETDGTVTGLRLLPAQVQDPGLDELLGSASGDRVRIATARLQRAGFQVLSHSDGPAGLLFRVIFEDS